MSRLSASGLLHTPMSTSSLIFSPNQSVTDAKADEKSATEKVSVYKACHLMVVDAKMGGNWKEREPVAEFAGGRLRLGLPWESIRASDEWRGAKEDNEKKAGRQRAGGTC